ncbi:MAG: hypothetical protein IJ727_00560 [Treponema sp.]|nr:hypothetical protein [Treponema sp.]
MLRHTECETVSAEAAELRQRGSETVSARGAELRQREGKTVSARMSELRRKTPTFVDESGKEFDSQQVNNTYSTQYVYFGHKKSIPGKRQ